MHGMRMAAFDQIADIRTESKSVFLNVRFGGKSRRSGGQLARDRKFLGIAALTIGPLLYGKNLDTERVRVGGIDFISSAIHGAQSPIEKKIMNRKTTYLFLCALSVSLIASAQEPTYKAEIPASIVTPDRVWVAN